MSKNSKLKNKIYVTRNYEKIRHYVGPYWIRGLASILFTIPVGIIDAFIAWSLKPYMDVILVEKNLSLSIYVPMVIIAVSLIQSIFTYYSNYLNTWVGTKISNDLKFDLFQKLLRQDANFFDNNTSGNIQMRFNTDVDTACNGLLTHLKMFAMRFFSSISLLFVLLINSWQLSIIAISILLLSIYPLTKIRKFIDSITTETVFSGAEIATHFSESFQGNRVITSYNLFQYQKDKFLKTLKNIFYLGIKMVQRTGLLSPLMHFLISIGVALIVWIGSYLILKNHLTAGGFVSFVTALLLLYHPVKAIGNDFGAFQTSLMALERVFNMLDIAPKIFDSKNSKILKNVKNCIEFKNVNFEYKKGRPVLKNISLKINVGTKVAFVGNSGGGKSTLVNLLPRFYEITSGKILIDGIDIKNFKLESLREKIAIVFQDNFLFSGTIRENILLGNNKISEKQLNTVLESACLREFIDSLEQGLDTQIGERGVLLSGGQKQRIAIARAFVKNAPIVILDEATSALDNKSEQIVQRAMENLMHNRTVLIIAHRLSTIKNADNIIVVNNGEIIESGTHEELLKNKKGIYSLLHNAPQK